MSALALGASAINMGSRFVATTEAPVHENVKRQIVENDERATQIVFREFANSARVARNSVSEEVAEISRRPDASFADVAHLASGERGREQVLRSGNMDSGMWWAGQSQGLIHEVASCAEVVDRILCDAEAIIRGALPAQLAD